MITSTPTGAPSCGPRPRGRNGANVTACRPGQDGLVMLTRHSAASTRPIGDTHGFESLPISSSRAYVRQVGASRGRGNTSWSSPRRIRVGQRFFVAFYSRRGVSTTSLGRMRYAQSEPRSGEPGLAAATSQTRSARRATLQKRRSPAILLPGATRWSVSCRTDRKR